MSETIKTVSRPASHPEHRAITTVAPTCLRSEDLASLVEAIGEELVFDYAMRQLLISFRSSVRSMLEAKDDNDEIKFPDEYFSAEATVAELAAWTPTRRVAKDPLEKVKAALGSMAPEEAAAILAQVQAQYKG